MPSAPDTGCAACRGRRCSTACRRARIIAAVSTAVPELPAGVLAEAVDATARNPAITRFLAEALTTDPTALSVGAPPVVGDLVGELRARGADLPNPTCTRCGRTGRPLTRSPSGGVCGRCRRWQLAVPCTRCAVVKPVAGRDAQNRPFCARCADRPQRPCGQCGRTRRIARRAHDGIPDICDACFRMPEAVCSRCRRRKPCLFATGPEPVCIGCTPRSTAICAHCGADRPPTARWPEGPVCDPCYNVALRRRGTCAACGAVRRLIAPPGPGATTCSDCAGLPTTAHTCTECGLEDKLYEKSRCAPCALRRRTRDLLRGGTDQIPPVLGPVYEAITTTDAPRTALNWLRNGAGAALLGQMASGTMDISHEALDAHSRPPAAAFLRSVLVANKLIPDRDEQLASTERYLTQTLAGITGEHDRRLVNAYALWRVLRRLRATAEHADRPRSHTRHAHLNITAAVGFLDWLTDRGITLADVGQGDIEDYLTGGPARYQVRDFLQWAAAGRHAHPFTIPTLGRTPGKAASGDERWAQIARLLHDDTIDLTDRVAGALLLLYGQQLSRIAVITLDQVKTVGPQLFLHLGRDDLHIPEPLAGLLQTLIRDGRPYVGVGSPTTTRWLFPGMQPGRPLTAARLGDRLRKLGIRAQPGRRAALTHLAAQLPAAVLADLLGIHSTTAVNWVHDAGGDWNRYAAQLSQTRNHQP